MSMSIIGCHFIPLLLGGNGNENKNLAVLVWNPNGARKRGYPRHDWTSKLVAYTRLGDWQMLAQDRPVVDAVE